jgi:hypothetical protein
MVCITLSEDSLRGHVLLLLRLTILPPFPREQ